MGRHMKSILPAAACLTVTLVAVWSGINTQMFSVPMTPNRGSLAQTHQITAISDSSEFNASSSQLFISCAAISTVLAAAALIGGKAVAQQRNVARAVVGLATPAVQEEVAFQAGQRVVILAPPVMQGKQGNVVQQVPNQDSFAVRLDSGSVFNFLTENLQDASATATPPAPVVAPSPVSPSVIKQSGDEEELEFQDGQRVVILGPPVMNGKQGNVVGPVKNQEAFAVRLDSGSVFNILTENLQDASAPAAPATASAPVVTSAAKASEEDQPEFEEGQRVVILGPPAMQGKSATVIKPILTQDAFSVRLDSGSVFNILTENLRDASGSPATPSADGPATRLTNPGDLLDGVDVFIFDCDGVIWRGDSLIDGIPNVLDKLRAAGKTLFFVTNNSTKSRAGYKSKFTSLGLDVKPEEIFSSSFAAAAYLEQTKFKDTGKKVYVIGEKGIGEELDLIGVNWFGAEADKTTVAPLQPGGKVEHDKDVGAVIVGFDRNINYYKLQYAQLCLNENTGCQFIATNLDRVTHLTDAQEWAGNGTMVGAVKGCTGMEPNVVGKPAPLMIDYIAEKYGIADRSRICMVGDRLDTDIAFGRNNGLKTCLTLSGVTSEPELLDQVPRKAGTEGIQPEFYVETINDFIK